MAELTAMPKYEVYKNSGILSLGDIPEHWKINRIKQDVKLLTGYPFDSKKYTNKGIRLARGINVKESKLDWKDTAFWPEITNDLSKFVLVDGDILIGMDGSKVGKNFCQITQDDLPILLLQRVARLRTKANLQPRYLFWTISSNRFLDWVNVSKTDPMVPHIAPKDINGYIIAYPTLEEQVAIAKFLDKKTVQIDEAIGIKEKQIELLKERKQIIIQQAVTQGLNPNTPVKDSRVEWIGEIPEHWEVRRSKFLFTQRKERAWKSDVQLSATQAYGVIPQSEYEARSGYTVVKIQFHLDKRKHVNKDDFVISMRSFQGGLERAWSSGCIRSSYVVLQPLQAIDPSFYGYLLKLPSYIKALQRTGNFIRDGQDLNFDNFSQVDLFIPPLEEQKAIAKYVKNFMVSSDNGAGLLQEQIEKLKEYKSTLINSAVTGKIKVF
jgi:type I restriction enzyme S subunit